MARPRWKTVRQFLEKLDTELLHDPPVPPLGVESRDSRVISTLMFTATSFTIAKRWEKANVHWQMSG